MSMRWMPFGQRYDKDSDEKNWSRGPDVLAARNMVKPAYRFTRRMIKPVKAW